MDLMWFLLLAHLTGDFALQSDRMAETKRQSTAALTIHVAIYVMTVGIAVCAYGAVTGLYTSCSWVVVALLAGLFAAHWTQDFIKARHFSSRQAYYIDQVLHLAALFGIRLLLV